MGMLLESHSQPYAIPQIGSFKLMLSKFGFLLFEGKVFVY